MIARNQLPDDPADWKDIEVSFERLSGDSPKSSPRSEDDVFEYVKLESADTVDSDRQRFKFIRTARVAESKYWVWEYNEEDGTLCFVALRENPDGSTILGLSEPNGLSLEQYLLADYYDEVYWS